MMLSMQMKCRPMRATMKPMRPMKQPMIKSKTPTFDPTIINERSNICHFNFLSFHLKELSHSIQERQGSHLYLHTDLDGATTYKVTFCFYDQNS